MAAGWVKVVSPEHQCVGPTHVSRDEHLPGSIWECCCGRQWELQKWKFPWFGGHYTSVWKPVDSRAGKLTREPEADGW